MFRPHARAPLAAAMWAAACLAAAPASAQVSRPENQVSLSASATREVPRDVLTITLAATRDGSDSATVQTQLKQTLDAALAEARKSAQPGGLDVRTGSFGLYPRYGANGRITGWQGSAELILEGKDMPRVAQVAGKLTGMNVTGTASGLSREARDRYTAEVTHAAIQNFRARAQEIAKSFGFANYALRDVNVQTGEDIVVPMMRASAKTMRTEMAADAPVPVEAGKASLGVTVSGSVQLMN
jgi:predicted secreted protein